MAVDEGREGEYKKRHDEIWPELQQVLKEHGVHNYSIFLHPITRQLFGYVEVESDAMWRSLARNETVQKWWTFMADVMPAHPDNSPLSTDLTEVFHLA